MYELVCGHIVSFFNQYYKSTIFATTIGFIDKLKFDKWTFFLNLEPHKRYQMIIWYLWYLKIHFKHDGFKNKVSTEFSFSFKNKENLNI